MNLKKSFILFIAAMLVAFNASATAIKSITLKPASTNNPMQYAVTEMGKRNDVFQGDILYVAVVQTVAVETNYYRLDFAGGNWVALEINLTQFTDGEIQEQILQELMDDVQRLTFFATVHGGARGFNLTLGQSGSVGIAIPWVCSQCRVTITDLPTDGVEYEEP